MARTTKNDEAIKDKFWDALRDGIVSALDRNSRFAYSYCEELADDVVNDISEDTLDAVVGNENSEEAISEFLVRLKSRYYHILEAPEQRELDKLLLLFIP